jgi:hypothetical protein
MDKNSPVKLSEHFSIVTDPRVVGRSDHKLIDIITIALCGIISGLRDVP